MLESSESNPDTSCGRRCSVHAGVGATSCRRGRCAAQPLETAHEPFQTSSSTLHVLNLTQTVFPSLCDTGCLDGNRWYPIPELVAARSPAQKLTCTPGREVPHRSPRRDQCAASNDHDAPALSCKQRSHRSARRNSYARCPRPGSVVRRFRRHDELIVFKRQFRQRV